MEGQMSEASQGRSRHCKSGQAKRRSKVRDRTSFAALITSVIVAAFINWQPCLCTVGDKRWYWVSGSPTAHKCLSLDGSKGWLPDRIEWLLALQTQESTHPQSTSRAVDSSGQVLERLRATSWTSLSEPPHNDCPSWWQAVPWCQYPRSGRVSALGFVGEGDDQVGLHGLIWYFSL